MDNVEKYGLDADLRADERKEAEYIRAREYRENLVTKLTEIINTLQDFDFPEPAPTPPEEERRTEPDWVDGVKLWRVEKGVRGDEHWIAVGTNFVTHLCYPTEEAARKALRALAEASGWTPVCPEGFRTVWEWGDGRLLECVAGQVRWNDGTKADYTFIRTQSELDAYAAECNWQVAYYVKL